MIFGDIVLSEAPIRGPPYNPGKGGWPTVRVFNKDTGVDGAEYPKQTKQAMCTELGPGQPHLHNFIKEYAEPAESAGEPEPAEPAKEEL